MELPNHEKEILTKLGLNSIEELKKL